MKRLLKKRAYDIKYLNLDSTLSTIDKINIEDLKKVNLLNKILTNLDKLKDYQDKNNFMSIVSSISTDVSILQYKLNQLNKSINKMLKA